MSKAFYMPFNSGDFHTATSELSFEEKAAYFFILDAIWCKGGAFPHDDKKIANMLRVSLKKWAALSVNVLSYFDVIEGFLTQKRVTQELQKVKGQSEKRSNAGAMGFQAKLLKNNTLYQANATPLLKQAIIIAKDSSSSIKNIEEKEVNASDKNAAADLPLPKIEDLENRLMEIVGQNAYAKSPNLFASRELYDFFKKGYPVDFVLQVIADVTKRMRLKNPEWKPSTWAYFSNAIVESNEKSKLSASLPAFKSKNVHNEQDLSIGKALHDDKKSKELEFLRRKNAWNNSFEWHDEWGERPDSLNFLPPNNITFSEYIQPKYKRIAA